LRNGRAHAVALSLGLTLGCSAGWHRLSPSETQPIPARQQAQLWVDGQPIQVHRLRITPDSFRAIPFLQPVNCDSCWLAYSRDQVDSVRVGDPVAGVGATIVVGAAALFLVLLMVGRIGPQGT
jgi:hypothetical protein